MRENIITVLVLLFMLGGITLMFAIIEHFDKVVDWLIGRGDK